MPFLGVNITRILTEHVCKITLSFVIARSLIYNSPRLKDISFNTKCLWFNVINQ